MHIIEIELINHVVIPKIFRIDLRDRNSIVCVDGYNGSGKSFLINNIHPMAANRRYSKRYAILKGQNGLKRIIYSMSDGREIEVIHEYIPKGDTHSCKSYINEYIKGIKTELNPTGHTFMCEELIKKYLKFDSTTFACSFLSPKTENLATVTASERKRILESTMNLSQTLAIYQANNREALASAKSGMKIYNKQIEELYSRLSYKSVAEFDEVIAETRLTINNKKLAKSRMFKKYSELTSRLGVLENTDSSKELKYVEKIRNVLDGFTSMFNMKEVHSKYENAKHIISYSEINLNSLSDKIEVLDSKLTTIKENERIKQKVEEYSAEAGNLRKLIASSVKSLDDNTMFMVNNLCEELINISESIYNANLDNTAGYDYCNITQEIVTIRKKIVEYQDFIDKYNSTLSLAEDDGVEDTEFTFTNNCNGCPYYSKFVLSKKFIKENHAKFNVALDQHTELNDTLNSLTMLNLYIASVNRVSKSLNNILTPLGVTCLNMVDEFEWVYRCIDAPQTEYIRSFKDEVVTDVKRLVNVESELKHLKELKKDNLSVDLDTLMKTKSSLESKVVEHKKQIELQMLFKDKVETFEDIPHGNLDSSSRDDITIEYNKLFNFARHLKLLKKEHSILTTEMESNDKDIAELLTMKGTLKDKRKSLIDTSLYIIDLKESLAKHTTLKGILEKVIPLRLLSENVKFIETMVNAIMEENEISLSLEIICEDKDIRIPVFTKSREVDDIALVSTGEMCLLGIALNAVIMHIIGYSIISFDELDANLDTVYRSKFGNLLNSIMDKLDLDQIWCVSHNVSWDIPASHIVLSEYDTSELRGDIISY